MFSLFFYIARQLSAERLVKMAVFVFVLIFVAVRLATEDLNAKYVSHTRICIRSLTYFFWKHGKRVCKNWEWLQAGVRGLICIWCS